MYFLKDADFASSGKMSQLKAGRPRLTTQSSRLSAREALFVLTHQAESIPAYPTPKLPKTFTPNPELSSPHSWNPVYKPM